MAFTARKYSVFGDCCLDVSKTEKRLIRATLKTYEKTGTLVFLKLFKNVHEDYEFQLRISLTMDEFGNLFKRVRNRESFPSNDTESKKQKIYSPSTAKI